MSAPGEDVPPPPAVIEAGDLVGALRTAALRAACAATAPTTLRITAEEVAGELTRGDAVFDDLAAVVRVTPAFLAPSAAGLAKQPGTYQLVVVGPAGVLAAEDGWL